MPKIVKAKFRCDTVTRDAHGGEKSKSSAVYDSGLPEDKVFYEASPSGSLEIYVNNKAVHGFFVPGQAYYLDFTPAEA